jgi:hypothetical protein
MDGDVVSSQVSGIDKVKICQVIKDLLETKKSGKKSSSKSEGESFSHPDNQSFNHFSLPVNPQSKKVKWCKKTEKIFSKVLEVLLS